jgi:ubiquinone/menaquinone biosynthesis C-methylase UbiE
MPLVRDRIRPALYDFFGARMEKHFAEHRRRALAHARGRVLEIGGGTGVNLQYYGPGVEELVITEPEEPMAKRLERKLAATSLPAKVLRAPAESLPVEDDSFDYVVSTLVLCTVNDQARALDEVRRVLKPGGQLLFMEHVHAEDPKLARWQDRLQPLQGRIGHGCHCNRATEDSIQAAGFTIAEIEHGRIPKAPPIVRPLIVGAALSA